MNMICLVIFHQQQPMELQLTYLIVPLIKCTKQQSLMCMVQRNHRDHKKKEKRKTEEVKGGIIMCTQNIEFIKHFRHFI